MKKIILIKDFENMEGSDKITISMDDSHYSLTCSHVKNNSSKIYLKDRQPDSNNDWALFHARSYIKDGYKVIQGGNYLCY